MSTQPPLTRSDADEIRALARVPVGQQQFRRRLLILKLLRQGFSRTDIRQFLRISHADTAVEE